MSVETLRQLAWPLTLAILDFQRTSHPDLAIAVLHWAGLEDFVTATAEFEMRSRENLATRWS